jgi:signal transduction histidine kinase
LGGEREPVDLAALAREVCQRQPSDRHHCTVEGDASVIGAYNPTRMMQVVQNLVENAVKYSPKGGTVAVRVWRDGDDARLTVTDNGIGIPAADLEHVFDRFHRATNVDDRRYSGMGLGLYICRGIVHEYGGRIWATSRPGAGSTFHVSLPLAAGAEQND